MHPAVDTPRAAATPAAHGLAALVALALIAPGRASLAQAGIVRGVVFDRASGRPRPDVLVFCEGREVGRTNADGAFAGPLPAGRHRVEVRAGACRATLPEPVPVGATDTSELVITLDAAACAVEAGVEAPGVLRMRATTADPAEAARYPLRGVVLSAEDGKPVAGARIYVRGAACNARAGSDGAFVIHLPAGVHEVSVIHPAYESTTVRGVEVGPGAGGAPVRVRMDAAAVYLDDFTVTAPRVAGSTLELLQVRRDAEVVSDVIGAEQMSRGGDSDAAGALMRVTGVTIVDGKYVYVRGMGERYSATLLDQSNLPSPEPARRVFPLDLIPTAMLESITIQKTFSADMPGDFGGGVVNLATRGFPTTLEANVSMSVGLNTRTTFQDGLHQAGGPTDWLGFGAGHRALPGAIAAATEGKSLVEGSPLDPTVGFTPEELERFGEMMPNVWTPYDAMTAPGFGVGASVGGSGRVSGIKLGALGSVMLDNDWSAVRDDVLLAGYNKVQDGPVISSYRYEKWRELTNEVTFGAFLNGGADAGEHHRVRLTSLVTRISDASARVTEGLSPEQDTIRNTRLKWVERMLTFHQLRGDHDRVVSERLGLRWRYAFALATRDEPDRRDTLYIYEPGNGRFRIYDKPENSQRLFSDLTDMTHDVGLDLRLSFKQWSGLDARAGAGVNLLFRDRIMDTRRFKFTKKGGVDINEPFASLPSEEIYTPERIGPGLFQLEEITRNSDYYEASQNLQGAYLSGELPLGYGLSVAAGLRVERSAQVVRTFMPFAPDLEPVVAEQSTVDVLPAVNITWRCDREAFLVRLAYGRTLNRPQFRELSGSEYRELVGGDKVVGNANLGRAVLENVDLRGEWWLSGDEVVALSAFYKYFHTPIEWVRLASADPTKTLANANLAHLAGVELEVRKNFGFVHPRAADLFGAVNAAYVYSAVDINEEPAGLPVAPGLLTSPQRALQGQSPYVINVQLGYDNVDIGTTVVLLYNVFGPRITEVGTFGLPDTYERPFHRLDLVFGQKLPLWGLGLTVKAKNLIDQRRVFSIEDDSGQYVTRAWRVGRSLSLGLSKAF